ncbi:hypothetical protein DSO57_1027639 [Entomophthora muscae]|uniref:Uncharacterized protein n=2 Tax=Entomophthora muscae TaxID=34485 RepID=A0ACC2SVH6_9FUNG|nr:hypothetical protein DSO57_1010124 [Entomophthora muscae]KAJ9080200.1 hypothetical protein DSO57_1027639 [Entomophthora muscae]
MLSFTSLVRIMFHPKSKFHKDIRDGLSSDTFDTTRNAADPSDRRPGLDSCELKLIMQEEQCSFDEARLIHFYRKCCENNIDPHSGLPLDPKAGFFPHQREETHVLV